MITSPQECLQLYFMANSQQRQLRKSRSTEQGVGGLATRRGRADPTLWEPLSPLTGEPQDLLDITGLRGGLPRTNISLFKSAWKRHKKLISSHLHYTAFRRSFPVLTFPCTRSMPNSESQQGGKGYSLHAAPLAAHTVCTQQASVGTFIWDSQA